MKCTPLAVAFAVATLSGAGAGSAAPTIPGQAYPVHDPTRPAPAKVAPGRASALSSPPSDAVVLFGEDDLEQWRDPRGRAARWSVEGGVVTANRRSRIIESRAHFGDCQVHLEWRIPADRKLDGQDGSNSGLLLMGRYEIQILNSHTNVTYPDGQAAAIYGQSPPLVNASRPPGEWESLDVVFRAPRFEDGALREPARVTVFHNGVLVHHYRRVFGRTVHGRVPSYRAHAPTGPIALQYHGDPVQFRNLWVRPVGDYDAPAGG